MTILESIAEEIEEKIEKASAGKIIRPSVLFCGCNPQLKKICTNELSDWAYTPLIQANIQLSKLN